MENVSRMNIRGPRGLQGAQVARCPKAAITFFGKPRLIVTFAYFGKQVDSAEY